MICSRTHIVAHYSLLIVNYSLYINHIIVQGWETLGSSGIWSDGLFISLIYHYDLSLIRGRSPIVPLCRHVFYGKFIRDFMLNLPKMFRTMFYEIVASLLESMINMGDKS